MAPFRTGMRVTGREFCGRAAGLAALEAGAVFHDQEVAALGELETLCRAATAQGARSGPARRQHAVARLVGAEAERAADRVEAALAAETGAVARVEQALAALPA